MVFYLKTKVLHAQSAGASAVIFADDICLCDDSVCRESVRNDHSPFVACHNKDEIIYEYDDDGMGYQLNIPSFFIFKADADTVREELKHNQPVQMEMKWSRPGRKDVVEYELWTDPTDTFGVEFLKNFYKVAIKLGDTARFTPRMYFDDGKVIRCAGAHADSRCSLLCTNHGRYCSTDPGGDLYSGVSGADVVKESLRRICIWNHYGKCQRITIHYRCQCMEAKLGLS